MILNIKKYFYFLEVFRAYQWVKNFLVFVPMFLANDFSQDTLFSASFTFISFCLMASVVYILNDISDIEEDRKHPRKKYRVFARGEVSIDHGYLISAFLFVFCQIISFFLVNFLFLALINIYLLANIAYSNFLKKLSYVGLLSLSFFYTLRIIGGGISTDLEISFLLLSFSFIFFFGLSCMKRLGELISLKNEEIKASDRGFSFSDKKNLKLFSFLCSFISSFILFLYLFSPKALEIYSNINFLFLAPILVFAWNLNILHYCLKGVMDDDPVIFAMSNKLSLFLLFLLSLIFLLAIM